MTVFTSALPSTLVRQSVFWLQSRWCCSVLSFPTGPEGDAAVPTEGKRSSGTKCDGLRCQQRDKEVVLMGGVPRAYCVVGSWGNKQAAWLVQHENHV